MTTMQTPVTTDAEARRDALTERLFGSATETLNLFAMYLGHRLGYYAALAGAEPMTAPELARRTGTQERYAREWLEQQTMTGILEVSDPEAAPEERRFALPAGHDEVLADPESLSYLAPMSQLLAGAVLPLPRLVEVFRTGGGIPYEDYGPDLHQGQADLNRPMFLKLLGEEWVPAMPDVHRRLSEDPPARIADVGCGGGWSSIALARTYPRARVVGFDLDGPSVELARHNAAEAGLEDRVEIRHADIAGVHDAASYDLVLAAECLHDMADPVGALRAMRALCAPGGTVLVIDERTADRFSPDAGDLDAFLYGCSVLHCLPAGMADSPSAGTGTVMRADTLRDYAASAGFRGVEVLPVEHFLFRFYRLRP